MVLRYATICSNAGFMGNPVVVGIYGSQGLLYASVYLIPLRIFMWSAGLSCFTVASPKDIVKKLVHHPCIIAVVIGMALMPFPDVVPSFLLQTMQSCSKCVLPVSMIVIGSIFVRAEKYLRASMEEKIRKEALKPGVEICRIVPAGLGESIGDIAALCVAMNL